MEWEATPSGRKREGAALERWSGREWEEAAPSGREWEEAGSEWKGEAGSSAGVFVVHILSV
jgi:hypothetical protein